MARLIFPDLFWYEEDGPSKVYETLPGHSLPWSGSYLSGYWTTLRRHDGQALRPFRRALNMVCLVTYDLNKEVVRPKIVKAIGDNWNWARLSESSYAIESDDPAGVYATLSKLLDSNDQLYVITLNLPYTGQGSAEVNQWLDNNLTW